MIHRFRDMLSLLSLVATLRVNVCNQFVCKHSVLRARRVCLLARIYFQIIGCDTCLISKIELVGLGVVNLIVSLLLYLTDESPPTLYPEIYFYPADAACVNGVYRCPGFEETCRKNTKDE